MKKEKSNESVNLDKKWVSYWIGIVMKVSRGFELDEKELQVLGIGLEFFDEKNTSGKIREYVKNAREYFERNI